MSKDFLLFDLDDTLLALNNSRELTLKKLFNDFLDKDFSIQEIKELILQNKDKEYFLSINKVLQSYNINVDLEESTNHFFKIYNDLAPKVEKFIINEETLKYLNDKYNLCLITGRPRNFLYEKLEEQLNKYFKHIVCHNDFKDTPRKPEPDVILKTIEKYNINTEYYIGNDIKDVIATKKSGLKSICTMYTSKNKDELKNAGCDIIIDDINHLSNIF